MLGILAAVAIPKFINLKSDTATATGSGILASAHDGVSLYRSGCMIRGGDIVEDRAGSKDKFDIDGVQSSYSGSCYPALDDSRQIPNATGCFEMFNSLLGAGQLPSKKYSWTPETGSSNNANFGVNYFSKSQDNGYKLFIHQPTDKFSYCHFYYIDGVDLTKTPYFFFDGDTGRMAQGVIDASSGINWADSEKLYN